MTEKTLAPPIQVTWPMVATVLAAIVGAWFHLDGKITGIYTELVGIQEQIGEIKESVARLNERLTSHMEDSHE